MKNLFLIIVVSVFIGCSMPAQNETEYIRGSLTMKDVIGNPSIFLMGQSNAPDALAIAIEAVTGLLTASINHGGQKIERWFEYPFYWIEMDMDFLAGREIDYFVWFHGETNMRDYDNYEYWFRRIVHAVSPNKEIPVIIIKVDSTIHDLSGIRNLQEEMAAKEDNWYIIETSDLNRPDGWHLDSESQEILAGRINDLIESISI